MLMKEAKSGEIPPVVREVAQAEGVDALKLNKLVAAGKVVIPINNLRENIRPLGIGKGTRIKINANIGTSKDFKDLEEELALDG